MPEYTEVVGNVNTIRRWLRENEQQQLQLTRIWAEPTTKEIAAARAVDPSCRTARGLADILSWTSAVKRGSGTATQPIWPYVDQKPLGSLSCLRLVGVDTAPRAVILNFQALFFQVRRIIVCLYEVC